MIAAIEYGLMAIPIVITLVAVAWLVACIINDRNRYDAHAKSGGYAVLAVIVAMLVWGIYFVAVGAMDSTG